MKCYGDGKPPGWDIIKSRWNDGIIKYKGILKDSYIYCTNQSSLCLPQVDQ
jgi:hypothetical protein